MMLKPRPFLAACGVVVLMVASREMTWCGIAERVLNFVLAYVAFWMAFDGLGDGKKGG